MDIMTIFYFNSLWKAYVTSMKSKKKVFISIKLTNIDLHDKNSEIVPIFEFLFLFSGAWVFCDRDDPDAFQLILKSQDGSLVSITPLGNIMWHREEGLASLDVVKLITRDVADADGNQLI